MNIVLELFIFTSNQVVLVPQVHLWGCWGREFYNSGYTEIEKDAL